MYQSITPDEILCYLKALKVHGHIREGDQDLESFYCCYNANIDTIKRALISSELSCRCN